MPQSNFQNKFSIELNNDDSAIYKKDDTTDSEIVNYIHKIYI